MEKSADAFRTISEVAADLALPQHVLRFWETRFPQIRPLKRAGGRRYYRPADVGLLRSIRHLLYDEGYTIKGVQRLLKEQGARGSPSPSRDLDFDLDGTDTEDGSDDGGHSNGIDALAPAGSEAVAGTPSPGPGIATHACVRDALALIEDCERILKAVLHDR